MQLDVVGAVEAKVKVETDTDAEVTRRGQEVEVEVPVEAEVEVLVEAAIKVPGRREGPSVVVMIMTVMILTVVISIMTTRRRRITNHSKSAVVSLNLTMASLLRCQLVVETVKELTSYEIISELLVS